GTCECFLRAGLDSRRGELGMDGYARHDARFGTGVVLANGHNPIYQKQSPGQCGSTAPLGNIGNNNRYIYTNIQIAISHMPGYPSSPPDSLGNSPFSSGSLPACFSFRRQQSQAASAPKEEVDALWCIASDETVQPFFVDGCTVAQTTL